MFQSRSTPFDDDVESATSENNLTEDWSLILQICDKAINYQDGAKFCLKAIMKKLHHNVPRVVIQALTLLDACVKNCDRRFLLQVASNEFTSEVRKLLGKMHPSAAVKLKELLQKWSMEEFKDDPELCIIPALYYKLKSEGVDFPPKEVEKKPAAPICTDPNAVTSQEEENDIIKAIEISLKDTGRYSALADQGSSEVLFGQISKSSPEPFKVRAVYDFDAAEDNELTIKIGEIVLVSDNSNSSWWKGSNHRGEGLFPANFVSEDLDFTPDQPIIEAAPVVEAFIDTSDEEIKINEEKIDIVLNWLNDVDPTEELSDPEDMVKQEKECYKMGPLIEENLQSIDKRLAMLNLVNEKIMNAFDLFHDLSDQFSTFPPNMKYSTSAMQVPYSQDMPPAISSIQTSVPNPACQGTALTPGSDHISNEQNGKKSTIDVFDQAINANAHFPLSVASGTPIIASPVNLAMSVAGPPMNQVVHPAAVMNPYGPNMMNSVFIPPGMPFPFQPAPQQSGYIPIPGDPQNYMNIVPPMGPYIPFPYYFVNNTSSPVHHESNVSTISSANKVDTISTSTAESNVLNPIPLTSNSASSYYGDLQQIATNNLTAVSSDQNLKQETMQNPRSQASADEQIPSSSSNENL